MSELDSMLYNQTLESLKTSEDLFSVLITEEETATITEELFVKDMLGFFADIILNDKTDPVFIQSWINFSGGHSKEVKVVNLKNEVLFKVPPLYDTSVIKVNTRTDRNVMSYDKIADEAALRSSHIPISGLRYYADKMNETFESLVAPNDGCYERWIKIFYRYGVIASTTDESVNKPDSSVSGLSVSDGLDDFVFVE